MKILGLNAFHGSASAALLDDGNLVAAVEEERLNRVRNWAGFPTLAVRACLAGGGPDPVRHVAISRDPRAHFWTKLGRLARRPGSWMGSVDRLRQTAEVARISAQLADARLTDGGRADVHFVEHHRAHMASAFFASPYERAAVVSIDGFGDFSSLMWGIGDGNHIDVRGCVTFPHSLGHFYTAFSQFLGFTGFGDEHKLMHLSALGTPRFAAKVRDVVRVDNDRVRLNLAYFAHHTAGPRVIWEDGSPVTGRIYSGRLPEVFGPSRDPNGPLQPHHADLAASVQLVFEECYFSLLRFIQRKAGTTRVCLAGSAALNVLANGRITERTSFSEVYVQPAAGDAGTALGAALHVWHEHLRRPRAFVMRHAYHGLEYSSADIERELHARGLAYQALDARALVSAAAAHLAQGRIVGWFQGRMEFGPRALGARSILADPRRLDIRDRLSAGLKPGREPLYPYACSMPAEAASQFVEMDTSPFLTQARRLRPERHHDLPAVTQADGTVQVQAVERDVNPLFWELLSAFGQLSGVPVLLNTSLCPDGPIVNTPAEAIDCFRHTGIDVLAIGGFLAAKPSAAANIETPGLATLAS